MFGVKFIAVAIGIAARTAMATGGPLSVNNQVSQHGVHNYIPPAVLITDSTIPAPIFNLSDPDVIYDHGMYLKPRWPNATYSTSRLDDRDACCSLYFSTQGMEIWIPAGYEVWSQFTVAYGSGSCSNGQQGFNLNLAGSSVYAPSGDVGSYNTVNAGCFLSISATYCNIVAYGNFGSYNCLGC